MACDHDHTSGDDTVCELSKLFDTLHKDLKAQLTSKPIRVTVADGGRAAHPRHPIRTGRAMYIELGKVCLAQPCMLAGMVRDELQ